MVLTNGLTSIEEDGTITGNNTQPKERIIVSNDANAGVKGKSWTGSFFQVGKLGWIPICHSILSKAVLSSC